MNLTIIDLEWTSGEDDVKLNEIIQIGAIKVAGIGGKVLDTYISYIRPTVHTTISKAAEILPFSIADLAGARDFTEVVSEFFAWCGQAVRFASWGANDICVLQDNLSYYALSYKLPDVFLNLQEVFCSTVSAKNNVSLYHAAEYCNIPTVLDFHSALNDSFYANVITEAVVGMYGLGAFYLAKQRKTISLDEGSLLLPPNDLLKETEIVEPIYRNYKSKDDFLNNRRTRNHLCPICGEKIGISYWAPIESLGYLSKASCPAHGSYYFFTAPVSDKTGKWCGCVSILKSIGAVRSAYATRDKSNLFICTKSNYAKKKTKYYYSVRQKTLHMRG